jgi:metallo-beta-lactamase class B
MKYPAVIAAAFCLTLTVAHAHAAQPPALDMPLKCTRCAEWNQPQEPFRMYGNTYYVGTKGLSSVLIAGKNGHVLLDGALPQSAPLIRKNIEALGYQMRDVKLILNSHAHFDHAGGIAALQAWSGAQVAASPSGVAVLHAGTVGRDDAQYEEPAFRVPPVRKVREVRDGETLRVGDIVVTAHFTPGHTPGSTTCTWQSCEKSKCVNVVYADSLNAVSLGNYRFTPIAERFRASIDKVAKLPCDLIVSVHPEFTHVFERHANGDSFIDPNGCRNYAAAALRDFDARLAKEREAR